MNSDEIQQFRAKLENDPQNRENRREFYENYEWLESYWQNKYQGRNRNEHFVNDNKVFYWTLGSVKEIAKAFTSIKPVGSSNNNFAPEIDILRATYYLKYLSDLYAEGELEIVETELNYADNWNKDSFSALFAIVVQIRNNLFHGGKTQLEDEQYERNKHLVTLGKSLTNILLNELKNAEDYG